MATTTTPRPDVTLLLEAEHAVAHVLAQAGEPPLAYPMLLEAMGVSLGWERGAVWEVAADGALRRAATWRADGVDDAVFESRLPDRVVATGRPAEERGALCFPVHGAEGVIAAIELLSARAREADDALLATMATLGRYIGQYVERCRAQEALRDSDARKSAILDAATDCIVTMDAAGRVVEVNRATELTFGYAPGAMQGRELAALIIPPELRDAHREGVRRFSSEGRERAIGHRLELTAMRADGTRFPVEITITRPRLDGPPLFTGYLRDVTERQRSDAALRALAEEQVALRRVATLVASERDPQRMFSVVTEEVGRLLGAHSANMIRYEDEASAKVVGAWSLEGVPRVEAGTAVPLDGETIATVVRRTELPSRVESYEHLEGELAERLRGLGFRSAVGAPIKLAGRLWGAVIVSSVDPEPFAPGVEHRIGEFSKLAAQALANAEAREELMASRARIVQAGDAERRRLERNLHDGAQQRLVGLALTIRLAARRLRINPDSAQEMLDDAGDELDQALRELRELARGLHPAILNERGLVPALEMVAARAPVPVEVRARVDVRLPAPVEAAAYYVVAEALTNVAKYAQATVVRIDVERDGDEATLTVADDGAGGARVVAGSGLAGLADRVEALGGRLEISSPPGEGTTVRARMLCRG